jgi:hypothetical protein
MLSLNETRPPALPPGRLSQIAGWAAYTSGLIGAVSVFFFVLFAGAYVTTGRPAPWPIGRINDLTSLLMYLVALPIPVALYQRLKARAAVLSRVALGLGMTGMVAVVVLQYLLVAGVLTFAQQGGPVAVAILVVGVWLLITGYLGQANGALPRGVLFSWLAVPYFGYPVWAFWVGRLLLADRAPQIGTEPA